MPIRTIPLLLMLLCLIACDRSAVKSHGKMTITPDERRFTVNMSLQTRGGALYVPESLPDSGAALVFALHGMGSSGQAFRSRGFDLYAEQHGFIVVYPDGLNGGWSSNDDNVFFGYVIDELQKKYQIDAGKVFMTGHSLGAIQCYESAIILGGKIRAIAPVSGPMCADTVRLTVSLGPQQQAYKAYPTRVLSIHALDDDVIPYDGKVIGNIYSVKQTLEFWRKVNGCQDPASAYPCGPGFDAHIWQGQHAECIELTRFRGGHAWPPTATETITGFFLELN